MEKKYISIVAFFAIFLIFSILPPIGDITSAGMRLIGLFLAFIFGMTVTSDPWPALFTIVMFPMTGLISMADVLLVTILLYLCFLALY